MSPTILYRIAAVLLLLFACGHTAGFLSFKPSSAEGLAVLNAMNSVAFDFEGNNRTYGGFYTGFGLTVTAYLLFSAFLAWYLGRLAVSQPRSVAPLAWALVAVQLVSLAFSVKYFFLVPVVFSALVITCLVWATLRVKRAAV
jgi:hypothetical protein